MCVILTCGDEEKEVQVCKCLKVFVRVDGRRLRIHYYCLFPHARGNQRQD